MRQMRHALRGPHHLGEPHKNFNAAQKRTFLLRKKSLKVNLL